MSLKATYLYDIDVSYVLEDQEIVLETSSIESIVINTDFDNNNFPIIYLNINIKSDIYDDMVNNMDTATIVLTVYKTNSNSYLESV